MRRTEPAEHRPLMPFFRSFLGPREMTVSEPRFHLKHTKAVDFLSWAELEWATFFIFRCLLLFEFFVGYMEIFCFLRCLRIIPRCYFHYENLLSAVGFWGKVKEKVFFSCSSISSRENVKLLEHAKILGSEIFFVEMIHQMNVQLNLVTTNCWFECCKFAIEGFFL